jgi:hypothetical protein
MMELACRSCGAPFIPTREDLLRGPAHYRVCSSCRAAVIGSAASKPTEPSRCRECGRVLRTTGRRLCLTCLGVPAL